MPHPENHAGATDAGAAAPGAWGRLARSPLRAAIAALLGAAAAGAYAHFVGCSTGTCPLTSNVWIAALYGAGVGAAVGWPNRRPAAERAPASRG